MKREEAQRMIDSGQWWDGDLEDWLASAIDFWEQADDTGGYQMEFDAADLSKILTELKARRAADD